MTHPIHRVVGFEVVGPYCLKVDFADATSQTINFEPMLAGELYGPLRDLAVFNKVHVDPIANTLAWPNGADFDPATLYDWPEYEQGLRELARRWEMVQA